MPYFYLSVVTSPESIEVDKVAEIESYAIPNLVGIGEEKTGGFFGSGSGESCSFEIFEEKMIIPLCLSDHIRC
jgi:hypothetical protein